VKSFTVRIATWQEDSHELRAIRETVFILEQHVPIELEWDGLDVDCLHVLAASSAGESIGTARLLPDGHIGRMAVLKEWRGRGVGSALLQLLLAETRKCQVRQAVLNAQTSAAGFYAKFGFQTVGEEFMDAGIPHVKMVLPLQEN